MANSEALKNLVRPPFANYDIVVYFGCGLFALPFIQHYFVEPFQLRFPKFEFAPTIPVAGPVISTLLLLFSVYIVGHMIAYLGSQVIEKTMDALFGKASEVVLATSAATEATRDAIIRHQLSTRTKTTLENAKTVTAVRTIFHLPVLIFYVPIVWLGVFGFYGSRVPPQVFEAARGKMGCIPGVEIKEGGGWFKTLEACVLNSNPVATARMYNYLLIAGLFRSMAMIFLASLWAELYYLVDRIFTGHLHVGFLMTEKLTWGAQLWGYLLLSVFYLFSLFSYLKFQRRYVEDAIFAFAVANEG
jgi:hypothetical protein